ncbi:MAG: ATP-binding cassette domain-containing protein [Rhodospirillales bacterium]|nr:ATP-binding cassette domain-containing protein [Rhodospirillales bacterium]
MADDTDRPAVARFHRAALRYGNEPEVLRDVSLDLAAGSFHFLLGPSGAGKTSLLRLLSLALPPSRGCVVVFGRDVVTTARADLAALRRRIGIVFQDFRLLPQLSVYDNVALPLAVSGLDTARIAEDCKLMLARTGLERFAEVRPPSLSGGQQQLVAIARALIIRPRLLIADEPTASVDETLALRLIALFQEVNRLGTTVLIATHNERLADRFPHPRLRLEDGHVLYDPPDGWPPGDGPATPQHDHAATAA